MNTQSYRARGWVPLLLEAGSSVVSDTKGEEDPSLSTHASVLGARQRLGSGSLFLEGVAKLDDVLLSPLAEDDRCWVMLAMFSR
jgi:hypothetical protein